MAASNQAADANHPSNSNILIAAAFWVIAITLSVLTSPIKDQPTWVWFVRVGVIVAGVAWVVWLIGHERDLTRQGLPLNNDTVAVDLWTVAHTMAGVVLGAWGIPFVLVFVFTIGWEFFERFGGGIGSDESLDNRIVDVVVAWMGWIVFAALTIMGTGEGLPWLPVIHSLLR